MALYLGNTLIADDNGVRMLQFSTAGRPASPVEGQLIYNTDNRMMEVFDGGYWKQAYDGNRPYLYRTIITTSYVAGGYKNSTPWRNVNRMVHSTDVMTNLGDQMPLGGSYVSGANSLTKGWYWGASDSYSGETTTIAGFNMVTETNAGTSFGTLRNNRGDSGTVFKEHLFAYIAGGGTADVDCFNMTTETIYNSNQGPDVADGGTGSGMSDENAGYLYTDGGAAKLHFSTTVSYMASPTGVRGAHGQQKGINSKLNKGWCGNEGSYAGGYNLRRYTFVTDTLLGTVPKPIGNCGEENFDMGQAHQYLHGQHDGTGQNNRGWKFTYSSETGYETGGGSLRTGVPGGSSGHCFWKG